MRDDTWKCLFARYFFLTLCEKAKGKLVKPGDDFTCTACTHRWLIRKWRHHYWATKLNGSVFVWTSKNEQLVKQLRLPESWWQQPPHWKFQQFFKVGAGRAVIVVKAWQVRCNDLVGRSSKLASASQQSWRQSICKLARRDGCVS